MIIASAVRAVLVELEAVTALVGTRIYVQTVPQSASYPAILIQLVDDGERAHLRGVTGFVRARVQVDSLTRKADGGNYYTAAYGVADAAHGALVDGAPTGLAGFRGVVDEPAPGLEIVCCLPADPRGRELFEADEADVFAVSRDYYVTCRPVPGLASAYQTRVLADGATAYWPLDDPDGSLTALDRAGTLEATIVGGVTVGIAGAAGNRAMLLDGSTGKLSSASPVSTPTTITIEAWIQKGASAGSYKTIFSNRHPSPESGDLLFAIGPAEKLVVFASGGSLQGSTSIAVDGRWRHTVVVVTSGGATFYVDGVVDASGPIGHTATGLAPFGIGFDPAGELLWSGGLSDVAIYPVALSAGQVAAHFAMRSGVGRAFARGVDTIM